MQYLCLIYLPANAPDRTPEEEQQLHEAYGEYTRRARESGKMISGEPLEPVSTASSVRVRNGKRTITDGPFAETKEWLAGFYNFECDSLDEALDWAAQIPGAAHGTIEVRPVMKIPGMVSGRPVTA
jgi:hypothetical protein